VREGAPREETDGRADSDFFPSVGESARALYSLTWLNLAQKAGVATPPGLTAIMPPPSAGSQEKEEAM